MPLIINSIISIEITLYCIFRIYSKQCSIQRAQLYFCAQEISSEIKIKENMNI